MTMTMSGRAKTVLGMLAGVALVAVTVLAATVPNVDQPAATEVAACTGQCADCPLAGTDQCPTATDGTRDAEACATVNSDRCIGCAKCVRVAPEAYQMNPQTGKAEIKPGAPADAIQRGAKVCPVGAIES